MKYKYIFFNNVYSKIFLNKKEYNYICIKDLETLNNVKVVNFPLEDSSVFKRLLYLLTKIKAPQNNYIDQISKYFPFFFDEKFIKEEDNLCFVIYRYVPLSYIKYLQNKYPTAKFVRIYRDLIKNYNEWYPEYDFLASKKMFDSLFTFDSNEAKKYGICEFSEYESRLCLPPKKTKYDVVFIGRAKNRMNEIVCAYDTLIKYGFKVLFVVAGCKHKIKRRSIIYRKKDMQYADMLKITNKAKCILEINVQNMVGFTSRYLEAVMYNKKLITNNFLVKKQKFYNNNFILCVDDFSKINPDFIKKEVLVDYNYENEFSPKSLIYKIESILSKEGDK